MFENFFKNKKVLITGNTGFKGSWLSVWLKILEAEVYGISDKVPTQPALFDYVDGDIQSNTFYEDIRNLESLTALINEIKPDIIFHLAAQPIVKLSYDDPIDTFSTNVMGTANIMNAILKLENDCVVVMITSDKCYENVEWEWGYREDDRLGGKDPYSASKGAAEIVIHSFYESFIKDKKPNIKLSTARAGNVIGGGDWAANRLIPDIFKAWSKNEKVHIRSPHSTRPWQHVLEPLSGYLTLAKKMHSHKEFNGLSYNFGPNSNQNHSVLEVLNELTKNWSKGKSDELFSIQENSTFHEAGLLKLNCDRALQHLSWMPNLDFEETLTITSKWYNEFYNGTNVNMLQYTIDQINYFSEAAKNKKLEWSK